MKPAAILGCLALALPFVSGLRPLRRHHAEVAQRAHGDVDVHERGSFNVFTSARFTFYDVGLGACGAYSESDEMVVALNIAQFGEGYPGPNCFKTIAITYGEKTINATIVDKCEKCPSAGGLDFSRGLFNEFADESVGVLYGAWKLLEE